MTAFGLRRTLGFGFGLAALAQAGCAKAPTELYITMTLDPLPARAITSLAITLDASGNLASRSFASLGEIPADASYASWTFPSVINFQIPNEMIKGVVNVSIEGSDPLSDNKMDLASGTGMAVVEREKTTATTIALTAVAPATTDPDGGTDDGGVPSEDAGNDAPAPGP